MMQTCTCRPSPRRRRSPPLVLAVVFSLLATSAAAQSSSTNTCKFLTLNAETDGEDTGAPLVAMQACSPLSSPSN